MSLEALVYVYAPCPACGNMSVPLRAWVIRSGYDEDGHSHESEVETLTCYYCGDVMLEDAPVGSVERFCEDVLENMYGRQSFETGKILSYHPNLGYRGEVNENQ